MNRGYHDILIQMMLLRIFLNISRLVTRPYAYIYIFQASWSKERKILFVKAFI